MSTVHHFDPKLESTQTGVGSDTRLVKFHDGESTTPSTLPEDSQPDSHPHSLQPPDKGTRTELGLSMM